MALCDGTGTRDWPLPGPIPARSWPLIPSSPAGDPNSEIVEHLLARTPSPRPWAPGIRVLLQREALRISMRKTPIDVWKRQLKPPAQFHIGRLAQLHGHSSESSAHQIRARVPVFPSLASRCFEADRDLLARV